MMEKMGLGLGVVAAMRTKEKIPGTILELPQVAGESEEINLAYAKAFRGFTGGDKSYPILFYCHHERCQLSVMATKRAVEAGYTKIYWLRAGNSGWVNAGLPLEGQQQTAQAGQADPGKAKQAMQVYQVGIRNCTSEVTDKDFAEIALKSPTEHALASNLHAGIDARKDNRDHCLKDLRKAVANADPRSPALAEIDTHIARGGDEIERGYKAARAKVEAAPGTYFKAPLDKISLSTLQGALDESRSLKSARQTCGTFNPPLPNDPTELNSVKTRLSNFRACLDGLQGKQEGAAMTARLGEGSGSSSSSSSDADEAIALITGSARYRCSVHAATRCLPDANWDRVARVATPARIDAYEKAKEGQEHLGGDIEILRLEANDYVKRLNAHIDELNAANGRSSASNSGSSYGGGGGYSPNSSSPAPVRRANNMSAPGMR